MEEIFCFVFKTKYLEAEWVTYFSQEIESVLIMFHKNKMYIQSWLPLSQTGVSPFNTSGLHLSQNWAGGGGNKTESNVLSLSSWSKTVQNRKLSNYQTVNITLKQKMCPHLVENSDVFLIFFFNSIILLVKKFIFKETFLTNWTTI